MENSGQQGDSSTVLMMMMAREDRAQRNEQQRRDEFELKIVKNVRNLIKRSEMREIGNVAMIVREKVLRHKKEC